MKQAFAEHAAAPAVILIHDPVAAGSFKRFRAGPDRESRKRELLFREIPDEVIYARQYREFAARLVEHFPKVIQLVELVRGEPEYGPVLSNPNQVFTRDSLVTLPWAPGVFVKARMRRSLRQKEPATLAAAARMLGLVQLLEIPAPLVLEGGDVIPFSRDGSRTLLVGIGRRTGRESLEFLGDALIPEHADEIIGMELAPWRMNLDGGLVPVTEDVVVADTQSIGTGWLLDTHGTRKIDPLDMFRELGMSIVEATPDESVYSQACNCVCLGGRKVLIYDLAPRVAELLVRHDVEVIQTPGSELVKGRGGPRCMTRPVY